MGSTASGISRRTLLGTGGTIAAGSLMAPFSPLAYAAEGESGTDYSVVIVGAGLAGLAAGLKLLDLGVRDVLIITKANDAGTGTNSIVAGGTFNFPLENTEEGVEKLVAVYLDKSNGKGREDLTRLVAQNIRADLDWLETHGCSFTEATQSIPYDAMATNAFPGSGLGMPNLMDQIANEFINAGGIVMAGTKLLDFVLDERGGVSGVKVRTEDGIATITSTATIVATGGYVANKQLLEQYVGPDADEIMVRGQPGLTGDGILAIERIGGMLYQMGGMDQTVHLAAVAPENPAMCNPYQAIQQTIAINADGRRYVDESLGYVSNGKAAFNQPGQKCALVFDSAIASMDGVKADMDKFATYGVAIVEAETLDELAEKIDVDPDALKATVEEFNGATDGERTSGLEVEKTACANRIETAPFYAFYPLCVGSIMCFGGVYTDGDCRVLEADGTPIENLYAAGEIIGGMFQYDYLAGSSLNRSLVTGVHVAGLIAEQLAG